MTLCLKDRMEAEREVNDTRWSEIEPQLYVGITETKMYNNNQEQNQFLTASTQTTHSYFQNK